MTPTQPGKGMGFTDWTLAAASGPRTPGPATSPAPGRRRRLGHPWAAKGGPRWVVLARGGLRRHARPRGARCVAAAIGGAAAPPPRAASSRAPPSPTGRTGSRRGRGGPVGIGRSPSPSSDRAAPNGHVRPPRPRRTPQCGPQRERHHNPGDEEDAAGKGPSPSVRQRSMPNGATPTTVIAASSGALAATAITAMGTSVPTRTRGGGGAAKATTRTSRREIILTPPGDQHDDQEHDTRERLAAPMTPPVCSSILAPEQVRGADRGVTDHRRGHHQGDLDHELGPAPPVTAAHRTASSGSETMFTSADSAKPMTARRRWPATSARVPATGTRPSPSPPSSGRRG